MDDLVNKIKNLKKLKVERSSLLKEMRQAKNKKLLSKENSDISRILELEDLDQEDLQKVRIFMRMKFEENLRLRNNENARQCLEALINFKEDKVVLRSTFKNCIEEIINNTSRIRISLRISILEIMQSVDSGNILDLHEYFEHLKDSLVREFVDNVENNPKALDKFLNEITNLKPSSFILENYLKFEKIYFQKVMSIIKEDETNALEDIVYVVHKIKKRNNLMGVSMIDSIRTSILEMGILKTEADLSFFEKMFC